MSDPKENEPLPPDPADPDRDERPEWVDENTEPERTPSAPTF